MAITKVTIDQQPMQFHFNNNGALTKAFLLLQEQSELFRRYSMLCTWIKQIETDKGMNLIGAFTALFGKYPTITQVSETVRTYQHGAIRVVEELHGEEDMFQPLPPAILIQEIDHQADAAPEMVSAEDFLTRIHEIPEDINQYNDIEIHPCVYLEGDAVEQCEEGEHDFYGVYLHKKEGGIDCIADCKTVQEAGRLACLIEAAWGRFSPNDVTLKENEFLHNGIKYCVKDETSGFNGQKIMHVYSCDDMRNPVAGTSFSKNTGMDEIMQWAKDCVAKNYHLFTKA